MSPTLRNCQATLVYKLDKEYDIGDIITVHTKERGVCVKRVIAKEGDKLELLNGKIYKNEHAQENLHNMLDIIDKKVDSKRRLEEIFDIVKAYGVNEKNLEKTKQEIAEYLSSK